MWFRDKVVLVVAGLVLFIGCPSVFGQQDVPETKAREGAGGTEHRATTEDKVLEIDWFKGDDL